jgi:lipopolysaccharide transport system permease protein/teichoic acid transport system permease protein
MSKFLKSLFSQKHIIWSLAKNDFRSRYLGSLLGILWAFLLPLVNIAIMWFAFQQGFRANPKEGVPFILWLVTGMFPWAFFSEAILSASNSILEKSFLVKKVVFQVELLPLIKIIASIFPFAFLSVVMLLLFMAYGLWPDQYWLQVPYYAFCLCLLVLSFSWLTSSVVVFYRDLGQVVGVGLQLGFWVTPIFWSPERLPEKFKFVSFLNPVSYIVTGYRNSLITKVWFWQEPMQTLYFWAFLSVLAFFGLFVFKRLRPHFADVL